MDDIQLARQMADWFLLNSNTVVGKLSRGSQPHEQFFAEFHVTPVLRLFLNTFVSEMYARQPSVRVLGSQAYRYLRMAVLRHLEVDAADWPAYAG